MALHYSREKRENNKNYTAPNTLNRVMSRDTLWERIIWVQKRLRYQRVEADGNTGKVYRVFYRYIDTKSSLVSHNWVTLGESRLTH